MWWQRALVRQQRYFYTRSVCKAKETINVPSMGDSISEGTVVEFSKQIGQAVRPDDVVVVLETDKISVDVRSPSGGVISKYFAEIDETVNVGAPLFEIDSDGSVVRAETSTDAAAAVSVPVSTRARKPLIKFLGKRSLLAKKNPIQTTAVITVEQFDETPREGTIAFCDYPAAHLPISKEEAEAIELGFAELY